LLVIAYCNNPCVKLKALQLSSNAKSFLFSDDRVRCTWAHLSALCIYYACFNRSTDYYFFIFVVSMLRIWSHGYNYVSVISVNIGYILIHELGCLPVMLTNTYDLERIFEKLQICVLFFWWLVQKYASLNIDFTFLCSYHAFWLFNVY